LWFPKRKWPNPPRGRVLVSPPLPVPLVNGISCFFDADEVRRFFSLIDGLLSRADTRPLLLPPIFFPTGWGPPLKETILNKSTFGVTFSSSPPPRLSAHFRTLFFPSIPAGPCKRGGSPWLSFGGLPTRFCPEAFFGPPLLRGVFFGFRRPDFFFLPLIFCRTIKKLRPRSKPVWGLSHSCSPDCFFLEVWDPFSKGPPLGVFVWSLLLCALDSSAIWPTRESPPHTDSGPWTWDSLREWDAFLWRLPSVFFRPPPPTFSVLFP